VKGSSSAGSVVVGVGLGVAVGVGVGMGVGVGVIVAVGREVGEGMAKPGVHPATSRARIKVRRR